MSDLTHPVFARLYDPVMRWPERHLLTEHRAFLASETADRVLDLGAGTGAQFPYFEGLSDPPETLSAVEPDPYMRRQAVTQADTLGISVEITDARAESLPYEDDTFDLVVASFVFCTIGSPKRALDEVARVLEPGGEFRFVEHIRAEGLAGRIQELLAPCWHAVAGGCHLDRQTNRLFCRDDRFQLQSYHHDGPAWLFPVVRGSMRRRENRLSRLRSVLGLEQSG